MNDNISTKNGLTPGAIVYIGNKKNAAFSLEVFNYNHDSITTKKTDFLDKDTLIHQENTIKWININGLHNIEDIKKICDHYQLHPLVIEDIVNTKQRPKTEEYENYIFTVLKMIYFDKNKKLKIENVSIILGPNFLLTFQEIEGDVFAPVRNRLLNNKGRVRTLKADFLQYALMDAIIDHYFVLIESMANKIEDLENTLFSNINNENTPVKTQVLKREILKIRKAVFPLREVIHKLEKSDHDLVHEKTKLYIRDLYDHIIHISENVEIYREMIWSIMDMYMTTISNKMNEVMKLLTVIATIFIPLTFVAGVYGMNFKYMPELNFKYSYFVFWMIIIILFSGMVYYFKRKKWL